MFGIFMWGINSAVSPLVVWNPAEVLHPLWNTTTRGTSADVYGLLGCHALQPRCTIWLFSLKFFELGRRDSHSLANQGAGGTNLKQLVRIKCCSFFPKCSCNQENRNNADAECIIAGVNSGTQQTAYINLYDSTQLFSGLEQHYQMNYNIQLPSVVFSRFSIQLWQHNTSWVSCGIWGVLGFFYYFPFFLMTGDN